MVHSRMLVPMTKTMLMRVRGYHTDDDDDDDAVVVVVCWGTIDYGDAELLRNHRLQKDLR